MNIGIDARLLERRMTGIGRFLKTFINELPDVDKENKYFLFSYGSIKVENNHCVNISTIKSFLPQKLFSPIWINFVLPYYLQKNKIDLFLSVNQLVPIVKLKHTKYILLLHDVIYKVDKTFHPFIYRKYLQIFTYFSVKRSDLIVTVSNFSKQDILKYYKISDSKIKVVYEAADSGFKVLNLSIDTKNKLKDQLNLPEHFVLYVGMIENRKNIKGILKIADEVFKRNRDIKFVLVGKIGYGGKTLLPAILQRENVVYLRSIDDQMLKNIYNIASVFLFPSFYEGFGFPPLEAMQSGLPVLTSNNTSLKEIIGTGGLMHEANDYLSFAEDIIKLIEDKEFYLKIRELGLERAKYFNIHSTVSEFVKIFNSLKN